jgi:uncharacterized RDD family membrane protein YckC
MADKNATGAPVPAGLLRRLAAMVYDALLLAALTMVVTGLFLPATGGQAVTPRDFPVLAVVYRLALVAVVIGFFGAFWTRRGQTLGMASWRIKVERLDGTLLGWGDVVARIGAALLSALPAGLGYLWIIVDPQKRAWHDILTRTRVVLLPKKTARRSTPAESRVTSPE